MGDSIRKYDRIWMAVAAMSLLLLFLFGCGLQPESEQEEGKASCSKDVFAMDTYMSLTAYGDQAQDAVDVAETEIHRIEELVSATRKESEIYQLNDKKTGEVSTDTAYLLTRSKEIYEATGGLFDITIYPVMEAWGFPSKDYHVPDAKTLRTLRSCLGADGITFTDSDETKMSETNQSDQAEEAGQVQETRAKVSLASGMKIDLGGIAKGYTSDRLMQLFKDYGIEHAIISLGGNVAALGKKPDGSFWQVAVEDPTHTDQYIGVLGVADVCVITSGGYERYFEENGKKYHHIIDPTTLYPADSGLSSVTIVSADGTLADALSTSLFIMGKEKAEEYWRAHSDQFDCILVEEDGDIYVSEGIKGQFTCQKDYECISLDSGKK